MQLPVMPPVAPMLAAPIPAIPDRADLCVEPKWDGFRAVVFRDGAEVEIGSRNERPLTRYFPEVVEHVRAGLPDRCVVDGEIVLPRGTSLDFEALLQRVHPAASRVRLLAEQTPAAFIAFDLLALGERDLQQLPYQERRGLLEQSVGPGVHLTPMTRDLALGRRWFDQFEGAGLDGVVLKPADLAYRQNERAMFKVKHQRSADCVVAGLRWHKSGPVVGSLLLGLYDDTATLHSVGVVASFTAARRRELVDELAPLQLAAGAEHPWVGPGADRPPTGTAARAPGGEPSRWNRGRDTSWVPLRPERVVEVGYDHLEGHRFRHTTQFRRWRPDRDPAGCTYAQLEQPVAYDLAGLLSGPLR
jgi:ATP-dependent DNA ligase